MDSPKFLLVIMVMILITYFFLDVQMIGVEAEQTRTGLRDTVVSLVQKNPLEGVTRSRHIVRLDVDAIKREWQEWVNINLGNGVQTRFELLSDNEPILAAESRSPVKSLSLSAIEKDNVVFKVRERVVAIWDEKK